MWAIGGGTPTPAASVWSAGLSYLTWRDPALPPPSYKEHLGFFTSQSSARLDAAIKDAIRTGAPYGLDLEMLRADGAIRSVTGRGEVERDAEGQVVLVRGTVHDVTERKQAENEIRLLARMQDGGGRTGPAGAAQRPSGKVLDEAVGAGRADPRGRLPPSAGAAPGGQALLLRAGVGWKEGVVGQATVERGHGNPSWVHLDFRRAGDSRRSSDRKRFSGSRCSANSVVSGMSVIISTGEGPYGFLSAHQERGGRSPRTKSISSGRSQCPGHDDRAPASGRSAAEVGGRILDLYNHAPCGYHSLDKDGVFVRINDTELSWLGYTREESDRENEVRRPPHAGEPQNVSGELSQVQSAGAIRDLEFDLVRKDGTILPVLLSATAITDSAGNYLMSRSTIYDITARKRAENEIRMLAQLQSVVADLGERALRGAPLSQMLDDAANRLRRLSESITARSWSCYPNRDALLMRAGAGWKPG